MALDIVAIMYIVLEIYLFAIGSNFSEQFLSTSILTCQNTQHMKWFQWLGEIKLLMMIKYLMSMLLNIIFSNIVLVQIFEWSAMLYIIITQENRSPGEILYDHQHENVEKPIITGETEEQQLQVKYRRIEIKLEKRFRYSLIGHNIFVFFIYLSFIMDNEPTQNYLMFFTVCKVIGIFYFCILVIIEIISFSSLYQMMMTKHRFEFETKIKSMKQHIAITLCSEFMVIFLQSGQIVIKYIFQDKKGYGKGLFSKPCLNSIYALNPIYSLQVVMEEYYGILYLIPIICISIVTVYYKSNDDLLQGISKLDVLLKVSVFQRYRDPNLDKKRAYTVATNSFVKSTSNDTESNTSAYYAQKGNIFKSTFNRAISAIWK